MLFSIITPTIGNEKLVKLLESINQQTYSNIEHIIVIDGEEHWSKVETIINSVPSKVKRYIIKLPFSTGKNNYYGHKIYASISQIVNGDYVILLDDDNSLQPQHIQNYYDLIKNEKYEWLYSLRNIVDKDDNFICVDGCESLGYLSPVFYNETEYMIDTNCTCIRTDVMIENSYIWNRKGFNNHNDPDRVFSRLLMDKYKKNICTGQYTVNYTVDNRPNHVQKELFIEGNKQMIKRYNELPWSKKQLYVIHFDRKHTEQIINRVYQKEKDEIGYKQWQMNLFDNMNDYCLLSGYSKYIPSGSKVLIHMCHAQELPLELFERKDVTKILYTIESPNIRHQGQWTKEFLSKFDLIITYWKPLLDLPNVLYFPFIHRFDFNNKNDMQLLQKNKGKGKSCCIILEKRDMNQKYNIDNINLQAQDYLRWEYVQQIKNIDCYGNTWEKYKNQINYKPTKNRFLDQEKTIDIMINYTFTLIIENCNAVNYVSEKIYDAFTVGSIPLYYGNNSELLNIPKDMYIDLKEFAPKEIGKVIELMDEEMIEEYRKKIYDYREEVLKKVSVNEYNKLLKSIIN
jgi:hypothetical protein